MAMEVCEDHTRGQQAQMKRVCIGPVCSFHILFCAVQRYDNEGGQGGLLASCGDHFTGRCPSLLPVSLQKGKDWLRWHWYERNIVRGSGTDKARCW